jgi:hypothetical protein
MDTLVLDRPAVRARSDVLVPQGYDRNTEMVAIRRLLTLGRSSEALGRLDIWLDRYQPCWRTGAGSAG